MRIKCVIFNDNVQTASCTIFMLIEKQGAKLLVITRKKIRIIINIESVLKVQINQCDL